MISLPDKINVNKKGENTAVFEIEPFYPGYGVTIGNSFRRVLLSSLEGAAVTEVKIKGVNHEFADLPGVLEDVVIILMNLKKTRFKNYSNQVETIHLKIKGEKKVKAKDFKLSPELKLANPNLDIATLTDKKANLKIEAKVEKGVGYVSSEEREREKFDVEAIELDAAFTPIVRVSFKVDNVIVGKRTDFEKLNLEIETDGTITPKEAFNQAIDILMKHFSSFSDLINQKKEKPISKDSKKIKIEEIDISERTKNALLEGGVKTLGGLIRKSEENVSKIEGLGDKGLKEIKKMLKKHNLELK